MVQCGQITESLRQSFDWQLNLMSKTVVYQSPDSCTLDSATNDELNNGSVVKHFQDALEPWRSAQLATVTSEAGC